MPPFSVKERQRRKPCGAVEGVVAADDVHRQSFGGEVTVKGTRLLRSNCTRPALGTAVGTSSAVGAPLISTSSAPASPSMTSVLSPLFQTSTSLPSPPSELVVALETDDAVVAAVAQVGGRCPTRP